MARRTMGADELAIKASSTANVWLRRSAGRVPPTVVAKLIHQRGETDTTTAPKGTPAWFTPATGDITVDVSVLIPDEAKRVKFLASVPTELGIMPARRASADRDLNVLKGMLTHEAAHSVWSTWTHEEFLPIKASVMQVIIMMEEIRIEKRAVDAGFGDPLRDSFGWLVKQLSESPDLESGDAYNIARAWGLCIGRYKAGLATKDEVDPIDSAAKAALGDEVVYLLTDLLDEAVEVDAAKGDVGRLRYLAETWVELVGEPPAMPTTGVCGGHEVEEADGDGDEPTVGATGDGSGDDDGESDSGKSDGTDDRDGTEAATKDDEAPHGHAKTKDGDPEAARVMKRAVSQMAKSMDAPLSKPIDMADPHTQAARVFGVPWKARRNWHDSIPSPADQRRAKRLARVLESLSLPSISKDTQPDRNPPGRLRGREMVRAAAERSMGLLSTATPWERTRRRRTHSKPIVVACATDVSGSMSWAEDFVAHFAYVVGRAGVHVGARTAAVTFGSNVEKVLAPGEMPTKIKTRSAIDGTERFDIAMAALDGVLHMSSDTGAAKVLFIVSDGHLVEHMEPQRCQEWIRRFTRAGTTIVWVGADEAWASRATDTGGGYDVAIRPGSIVFVGNEYEYSGVSGPKLDALYNELEKRIVQAAR